MTEKIKVTFLKFPTTTKAPQKPKVEEALKLEKTVLQIHPTRPYKQPSVSLTSILKGVLNA
jgi:hypothetical protein